jgi:IMP and pyridine-specific 5'-nucleotidase
MKWIYYHGPPPRSNSNRVGARRANGATDDGRTTRARATRAMAMTMRWTRVAPNAANAARGRRVDARRGRAGTRDGARGTTTTTTAATAAAAGRARTTTRRAIGPSEPTSFVEDEPRDEEIEAVVNEGRGNAGTGAQDVGRAARYMRELIKNQVNSNHLARAGSITDSSVLRRKGRLKEQDALIEFIVELHKTHTTEEVFTKVETWIDEVLELPKEKRRFSKLSRMVPAVGFFFHRLPLLKALREYDEFSSLSKRRYVLPNFAEVRHILNIAQVHASSKDVRLVTFDADGTLYADGEHFEDDNKMIDKIMQLMELGIHVAIVTAAGYPGEPTKFEGRLKGLVDAFEAQALPKEVYEKFHVMGGECNYLLS